MADRLAQIEERINSVSQLSSVVAAIRGIAAARLREGEERLAGVRAYAEAVGIAIGEALAMTAEQKAAAEPESANRGGLVLILCGEQGFVGGYNSRILDTAGRLIDAPGNELVIIGNHGLVVAEERGLRAGWSAPMATHVDEANGLANRLADMLYDRVRQGVKSAVIVHAFPDEGGEAKIVERSLIPFDFSRFPIAKRDQPPLTTLPPEKLLAQLAEEYVFAELCEATTIAFAAESEARMRAMIAAHENIDRHLAELKAAGRRQRQEEITAEVVELAAGVQAGTGERR